MDGAQITTLVVAVLTGGSIGAFFQWRTAKNKEPIEKDTAAVAAARSNVEVAISIRDIMKADLDAVKARQVVLEAEVATIKKLFDVSIIHIRQLWAWIGSGRIPPPPALPPELHSLVELPELHMVGEEQEELGP